MLNIKEPISRLSWFNIISLNTDLTVIVDTETVCGTFNNQPLYRKVYRGTGSFPTTNITLDTTINSTNVTVVEINEVYRFNDTYSGHTDTYIDNTRIYTFVSVTPYAVLIQNMQEFSEYTVEIKYIKN